MGRNIVSWVGEIDLRVISEPDEVELEPIANNVKPHLFHVVVLLSKYHKERFSGYVKWLQASTTRRVSPRFTTQTSPAHLSEVYKAVVKVLSELVRHELSLYLSPGTPAKAAAWTILAKTRFPAKLIESSLQHGVKIASVPFDISADFIPDLLRRPDKCLERLSASLPPDAPEFEHIIHRCDAMKQVILKARKVAPRTVPVLIEGESGTGKELLARAIHNSSPRRGKPFIPVNCGTIPTELVESELVVHMKGALPGTDRAKDVLLEIADDGTRFLDKAEYYFLRRRASCCGRYRRRKSSSWGRLRKGKSIFGSSLRPI